MGTTIKSRQLREKVSIVPTRCHGEYMLLRGTGRNHGRAIFEIDCDQGG